MEKKVQAVFDSIRMPDSCARRIGEAMAQRQAEEKGIYMRRLTGKERGREWIPAVIGALCLAVVLAWGLLTLPDPGEETAEATGFPVETTAPHSREQEEQDALQREMERLERLQELQKRLESNDDGWDLQQVIAKYETILSYTEGNLHYTIYRSGQDCMTEYDTNLHTPFTECIDGKVYFTANGEYLDITEKFSEEEPFTYIFTDRMYMEHYIAIGGTAENPGWLEMMYTSWEEKPFSLVTGSGVNTWNNLADERYGWETKAKEVFSEYDVHWPS